MLTVKVDKGELLAFGSANPRTDESFNSGNYTTYYGRTMAVIRCKTVGEVVVNVSGANLVNSSATITVI